MTIMPEARHNPGPPARRLKFGPASRLRHDAEFKAVFDARVRKEEGGLVVMLRPNSAKGPRLGLSIGRSAGGAVERNRAKRLIREAFRMLRHEFPRLEGRAYDIVVRARAARGLTLEGVRAALSGLVAEGHRVYERRALRGRGGGA